MIPPPHPGYPHHVPDRAAQLYRAHGMEPPWERVWRDGRDVTDEPPESWPWPWNTDKRPGER